MSSSKFQRTVSRIRSKLGFRSLSRSSSKNPSYSTKPTSRNEQETVGEEKGASDHITLKGKEGELADETNLIGGSNVRGHEITRARESQDQLKNGESKLEDLPDSLSDETGKGKSKRTKDRKVHDANMRNREKEDSTSPPFPIESGKEEIKKTVEGEDIEKEKPSSAPLPNESREKEIKRVRAVEEEEQGHSYIVKGKEDSKPSSVPLESETEEIKMTREGEKQADDRRDGGKEQSIPSAFPEEIRRVGEEKEQFHDSKIKEKEDSTSFPFTVDSGREGIKMTEESEEQDGGRRDRGKEEPTPAPLANGTGGEEITKVRGTEEQAYISMFGQKEDSTSSRFPIENGKVENKVTEKREEQDGDKRGEKELFHDSKRDGGKEQSIPSAFPEEIRRVGEEKEQFHDSKIKEKEDSTSFPFTVDSSREGIKMTEESEEQDGGRRDRGKEEPTPAPLANGTGGEEITKVRGTEEQAYISMFGQKEDSTSSRFPIENGKVENKVTEKGEEQDGDKRDQRKEESISATLPNESSGDEIKRMKGGEPTSLLPSESGTEKMKRMDEGLEQGVDMRTREKEELTSSPLPDKNGRTAVRRMTKGEEHAVDWRDKEKEDSASSPLSRGSGREETKWVSKGEEQAGCGSNQDKEDSTSSPPSLMPMPKNEKVSLGEQISSSLPSEATADQERKISETIEGQTSDRSHQIKEDSVFSPLIPVQESKAIDVGEKMPQTAVSSSPKQTIEEGWRLERSDKTTETKEGGKAEHIAFPSAVTATTSGEDLDAAGSSIMKPKSIETRKGEEEILKDHKELETKLFLLPSDSKEEIKRMNEGQLVPKEDSMPMLATNLRGADTSLCSEEEEEEKRSRSKSVVASERTMPSSSPVSATTSGEDLIGENNRMKHKVVRSKEEQAEEEKRKISKTIKEEITSAGEREAQGLLVHEMLIKLGNESITTSTLLEAIQETIHKEMEELKSTLFSAKEELKGQVEGGGMICTKTHLKFKENDEDGREREELRSREKSRLMSSPSSTPATKEEDKKKSDVEGRSGDKTQVPRGRDGKVPKEIEGREVMEQMRDGEDERKVASASHKPKPTDEEKTSLGKEQEKKGGTSYGSSSGTAFSVLGVMAAITSIGTVVLLKRLENVRRRKYK